MIETNTVSNIYILAICEKNAKHFNTLSFDLKQRSPEKDANVQIAGSLSIIRFVQFGLICRGWIVFIHKKIGFLCQHNYSFPDIYICSQPDLFVVNNYFSLSVS